MSNELQLKGRWQNAKGRIREAWGDLTDDDMDRADGNWDQLVGTIREKTGQATEMIEDKLDTILDSISDGGKGDDVG